MPTAALPVQRNRVADFGLELWHFGVKEAISASFAALFFAVLLITQLVSVPGIERYDLILIGAILIQIAFVKLRIETLDEVKVILLFHVIGLVLEIYKTQPSVGSWSYPDPGLLKISTVPLYSGFMYSAVGSYVSIAWKQLQLRLTGYPSYKITVPLTIAIYANFFTNHFWYDIRWILAGSVVVVFWRTKVFFTPHKVERWMPVTMSFGLIAFFVWVAENISTLLGAWQYPNQSDGWTVVHVDKVMSWSLLVIISFVIVADLKHLKANRQAS